MPLNTESGWSYNPSTDADVGTYTGKSCLISGSNEFLNKTWGSAASDLDSFTISMWIKRGNTDSGSTQYWLVGALTGAESNIRIQADKIYVHLTGSNYDFVGTRLLRDTSAWYHLVFRYNSDEGSAGDRFRCYINGELETWSSSSTIPSGTDNEFFANTNQITIGAYDASNHRFNGYIAQVCALDGQSLAPTSFIDTSSDTGSVVMKEPLTGLTFGDNGFLLEFKETGTGTASTSTIGADTSGETNHLTSNNLVSGDSARIDTPVDNFSVLNFVDKHSNTTLSEGGLKANGTASSWYGVTGTTAVSSGKYYWEVDITALGNYIQIGICDSSHSGVWSNSLETYTSAWGYYSYNGNKLFNSASTSYGATYTTGDTIGVGLDMDAGKVYFYKNGAIQNSGTEAFSSITGHIRPIVQLYGSATVTMDFNPTCPTGYLPLSSANLPEVEIGQEADDLASDHFNILLYTGNTATPRTISGVGFESGMTIIQPRSSGSSAMLYDDVRGAGSNKQLTLATGSAEGYDGAYNSATYGYLSAFNSDGFVLTDGSTNGNWVNANTTTFVSWNWKLGTAFSNDASATGVGDIDTTGQVNEDAGISCFTYSGSGSAGDELKHGLTTVPHVIWARRRNTGNSTVVYHHKNTSAPETDYLDMTNTNGTQDDSNLPLNDTVPTTSVITVSSSNFVNASSDTYVMWVFSERESFSKYGGYTGNGSTDGTFVYTGFTPRLVMYKRTNGAGNWVVVDSDRSNQKNPIDEDLLWDYTDAEAESDKVDFVSNGFKCRETSTQSNGSSDTYIYMAFAETPFKYATAR